jgi:hypothetical protein
VCSPGVDEIFHGFRIRVEDHQGETGLQDVLRHGIAHVAEPDEPY